MNNKKEYYPIQIHLYRSFELPSVCLSFRYRIHQNINLSFQILFSILYTHFLSMRGWIVKKLYGYQNHLIRSARIHNIKFIRDLLNRSLYHHIKMNSLEWVDPPSTSMWKILHCHKKIVTKDPLQNENNFRNSNKILYYFFFFH